MSELGQTNPERLQNASLPETERFLSELYGLRDDIYLPGREIRIDLLYRGIDDLQKAVRKEAGHEVYEVMCARIVSRILCVGRAAGSISLNESLESKYPLEGCAYCGKMPCECLENRNDYSLSHGSNGQANWSLRDWQTHLNQMYGDNNLQRGVNYCLLRLNSEYGELITLEHAINSHSVEQARHEYGLELADALAWTIAPASILGVDLQTAVEKRYGSGCQTCRLMPCDCPAHSFDQVDTATYVDIFRAAGL